MITSHESDFLLFELIAEFRANLRRTVSSIMLHNNMSVLSLEMAEIVICLGKNGKLNQQEVAHLTLKDKASVSRLIKKLTQLNIVSAVPGNDHRLKLQLLTDKGIAIYHCLSAAVGKVYESIKLQLTPGEYTLLIEIIKKLTRNNMIFCNS